jgi:proliferating cell nuclear antigen
VLRRVKAEDNLTLEVVENKFKIILKGRQTRTFHLPLIDLEEKDQKIPELNFKAKVTTDASILTDAIEDMDIIGESVIFIVDKKALNVNSASELTDANVEIKKSDSTKIETPEKVRAKYSIEYLKKMIQGSKLAPEVTINFSKDYPLKLDYLVVDKIQLSFILAPRVDTD